MPTELLELIATTSFSKLPTFLKEVIIMTILTGVIIFIVRYIYDRRYFRAWEELDSFDKTFLILAIGFITISVPFLLATSFVLLMSIIYTIFWPWQNAAPLDWFYLTWYILLFFNTVRTLIAAMGTKFGGDVLRVIVPKTARYLISMTVLIILAWFIIILARQFWFTNYIIS
ncbi:MAG: hypothetical protein HYT16_02595 [DPANN group archaeon]|nr:hypothetical protein [DPANN group archaeon]